MMEKSQNLLTIKAFAEASGRSQQTIYKQIGTRLAEYCREIDGQKYIEHRALKEVFGIDGFQPVQPEDNNSINPEDNPENPLYAILKAELDAKNRLIEKLQDDLEKERKHSREQSDKLAQLADQAQQLHAGDMRRLSPVAMPGAEFEPVEAFEEEEGQKPVQEPSAAQNGLQEAVRGLSFGEKWKLLFSKRKD